LSSVLSPDAEADLLSGIHSDPLFVEDVVRRIARSIGEIDMLKDGDRVVIKCRSMESIHPHDLLAEIDSELGKLRKN
ncbi:GTP cyclohydrolase, partial [mine drainage metagenome]